MVNIHKACIFKPRWEPGARRSASPGLAAGCLEVGVQLLERVVVRQRAVVAVHFEIFLLELDPAAWDQISAQIVSSLTGKDGVDRESAGTQLVGLV